MNQSTFPTTYQKKILWRALTGVSLCIITGLTILFIWLLSEVLGYLQPVLIPVAVAGIIAYLLDPIVVWFQKKRLTRLRAVLSTFGIFVCAALTFSAIIIPPITKEVSAAIDGRHNLGEKSKKMLEEFKETSWGKSTAEYLLEPIKIEPDTNKQSISPPAQPATIVEKIEKTSFKDTRIGHFITNNVEKIAQTTTTVLSKSTGKIMSYFGLAIGFIMIPLYLYYFLTESAAIKENWHLYVPLKASKFKTELIETLKEINGYLIAFFRGQVLVGFIDGLLVGITLMLFGLPYGLVIGILMAFLGIIPFLGNIICLIPACIIAYVHFSVPENQMWLGDSPLAYVGAVMAIFLVVQQINSLVTAPKIVGDSVGLHPMTVIFSMLFWSLILGGFIGALLAVPMTAAVKVVFVRYVWERKIMESNRSSDESDHPLEDQPEPA